MFVWPSATTCTTSRSRQVHVPFERHAEAGSRLLEWGGTMCEEDMQVDLLGKLAKQRSVILDRVGCQDGEAQGWHFRRGSIAVQCTLFARTLYRSKASSRAAAMRRALSRAE